MTTVLVTAAGGGIGVGAIRSIERATDCRIVGVDVEPKAGGLYRCDAGYALPPATDDAWPDALAGVIREEGVDVVVPLIDAELARLEAVRDRVPADVSFLVAREGVCTLAYDKYRTSRHLADAGVTVPEIVTGDDLAAFPEWGFPAVVKPRTGQGNSIGDGVEVVGDRDAAAAAIEAREAVPDALVVEEYVEGTEYTTEVVATAANELVGVVPKEAVSSDPYHRATRDAPAVRRAARRVFDVLDPRGVLNVQTIVRDGEFYTFEVNPRFSASSSLTAAAGVNGFALAIRDARGERVAAPGDYERDLHLFRHPESVYVTETAERRP